MAETKSKVKVAKTKSPKTKVEAQKTKTVAPKVEAAPVTQPINVTGNGKVVVGKVISDKMTKTVVVEVVRLVAHPIYSKRMRRTKKFHAHNEIGAKKGDTVMIVETRPISKTKNFIVHSVVTAAK